MKKGSYLFNGYTLRQLSDRAMEGYDGLNYQAAQVFGVDNIIINENEILLNETSGFTLKIHTIIHEITESRKMKDGWSYWDAHKHAEKMENDFGNLKKMFTYVFNNRDFYEWLNSGTGDGQL